MYFSDMLTYENITIGQRVEILSGETILYGTVLYKGPIVSRRGIWLGIDLTTPDGDNDGSWKGRVYFRAPMNFGLFTTIDHVRLASNIQRKQRSFYRTVNKKSTVEEELFGNTDPIALPPPRTDASIQNSKVRSSLANPHERPLSSVFSSGEKRFPRPHSLSSQMEDKLRKQRQRESLNESQSRFTFAPAPSIPKVFMPPSEVNRAKRTGFEGMSIPRYTVVYDQHHFLE